MKTFRLDKFVLYLSRASTDALMCVLRAARSDTTFESYFFVRNVHRISYRVGKARRRALLTLRCSVLHSLFSPYFVRCVLHNLARVALFSEQVSNLAAFLVQQSLKHLHRPFCPTIVSLASRLFACRLFCS